MNQYNRNNPRNNNHDDDDDDIQILEDYCKVRQNYFLFDILISID